MPKPSERIEQLIGETRSDPEYQERKLNAIIEYLNEQACDRPAVISIEDIDKILDNFTLTITISDQKYKNEALILKRGLAQAIHDRLKDTK